MNDSLICEDEEEIKRKELLQETIKLLNNAKLRNQDLVTYYAELGFSLGSSIEEYTPETVPSSDQLEKQYYEKPTIGKALMLQSLLLKNWKKD